MTELTATVVIESLLRATADDATPIIRRLARNQARVFLDSRAGDAGEGREWPDIGDDPMQHRPYEDRMAVSADAIRKAYTVQQPIVPDQTALVWRWHLGALLEAEIRLRSILADEPATPAPAVDAQSMPVAIPAGTARDAVADLEQFLTDHSGNEETTEGMEADERAHNAMGFVRRVIRAAMDLCDGATDDCTAGRIVTVDGDDFDQLNAALDDASPAVDAVPAGEVLDRATLNHCADLIRHRAVTVSSAPLGGGYVSEASKIAARHLISAAEDIEKQSLAALSHGEGRK